MLRLTVLSGARAGLRVDLAKPVVRIGRAPDNDLALDPNADLDASGYHCEIRGEGGHWKLVDCNSRNGIFLPMMGMSRVREHYLAAQDQFQLGPQGPRVQVEIYAPPVAIAQTGYAPQAIAGTIPTGYSPTTQQPIVAAAFAPAGNAQPMMPPPMMGPPAVPPPPQPPTPGGTLPAGAQPPPPPPGAPGKKPMGQQTLLAHVGVMLAQQQKRGKSTMEIKALVDQNVQQATGRMRLVIGMLAVMVLLAGGAIAFLATRQPSAEELEKELEKLAMNDPKRKEIEKKIGAMKPSDKDVGRKIYDANKSALFMLVAHDGDSYEHGGFCTAFAIKPDVLASNAHCVKAAEEYENKGADIWAHLNDSSKNGKPKMFPVAKHRGHPKYRHEADKITPDVGLFQLEEGEAPATVVLAEKDELKQLGTGDALFAIGFPGRTMNESSPLATFMPTSVGRVTDANGEKPETYADGWLIQHEGQTTPGTSGSPIFDAQGHVVAINAGGLLEANKQAVYKYAMRIDLLKDVDLGGAKKKK
jgi:V8-like Glu-specific endopeptidase